MARERYLVGVNKEELVPDPSPKGPDTARGKIANFWYHYKWMTLGGLFVAAVVVILVVQLITKPRYDYTICIAVPQGMTQQATDRLEAEFAAVGKDRNGDGKVLVALQTINLSENLSVDQRTANHTSLSTVLMTRDTYLFAFGPTYYEETLLPALKNSTTFFAPLDMDVAGISEDGTYWNWKDSALRKEADFQQTMVTIAAPEEMYFGVRDLETKNDKEAADLQAHIELLKAFIAAHA